MLNVIRDTGAEKPYVGAVPLVSGEIAEDIATYYAQSEQIPTILSLGVLVGTDGLCRAAGGVMVQLLPFADNVVVDLLERNASRLTAVSSLIDEGSSLRRIAEMCLQDIPFDVFDELPVAYRCPCTRERMAKTLVSLGREQVAELFDEQEKQDGVRQITMTCRFCGKKRVFGADEVAKWFD